MLPESTVNGVSPTSRTPASATASRTMHITSIHEITLKTLESVFIARYPLPDRVSGSSPFGFVASIKSPEGYTGVTFGEKKGKD